MSDDSRAESELWESYERAYRSLLWRVRARRLQLGVESLLAKARAHAERGIPAGESLQQVYQRAREQVIRQLVRSHGGGSRDPTGQTLAGKQPVAPAASNRRAERVRTMLEAGVPSEPIDASPDFQCDAALGGLARWLRAAGYDAAWWPGIDDDLLLRKSLATSSIMLTTDRRLMRRGVITRGVVSALLIPNGPTKRGQLAFLLSTLDQPIRPARCMSCGGRLRPVEKTAVRDRIPPLTYPWRNDYYVCERCDKLFWDGTHWQHIADELATAKADAN